MFLRRTLRNANNAINEGRGLIRNSKELVHFAKDLVADLRDGMKIGFILLPGTSVFVTKFVSSVATYLVSLVYRRMRAFLPAAPEEDPAVLDLEWAVGKPIPIAITIDVEYDALPPHDEDITFHGGRYDGRTFPGGLGENYGPGGKHYGKIIVTMESGETYIWDGFVMSIWEKKGDADEN